MHPLFVHFPIGLLVVYGLMELVPQRFISNLFWWRGAKLFLLTLGVLALVPTLITGDAASHEIPRDSSVYQIVEKHEMFAQTTSLIFFLLFAAYMVRTFAYTPWIIRLSNRNRLLNTLWQFKQNVSGWILDTPLRSFLALAGLIAITITGGLGASMVYGPEVDPIVSFIYGLVM